MTTRRAWLCLLLLLMTPRYSLARRASVGEYVRVQRAIEQWRIPEAKKHLRALQKTSARAPETTFFAAKIAFFEGRYGRAAELLNTLDGTSAQPLAREWRPLARSSLAVTQGFAKKEFAHFVIGYRPGKDEVLVDVAGEALEAAYVRITRDLGHRPPDKIRVEIFGEVADLARSSQLTQSEIETSGTIALCKYNKLMVVSPRALVFGYPWLDTLAHELTHYIITQATRDRVPIWLHEGLAKFEETRWRAKPGRPGMGAAYAHVLATALKKGRLISFDEMHPSMAKLPSQTAAATAFAEVYTIVAYVHQKFGYKGVRNVLALVTDGRTARGAMAEQFGEPWEKVEASWKVHLRTLHLRPNRKRFGVRGIRTYRFKKGKADKDIDNVGVEEVGTAEAIKFARLGGLLRSRGMYAPAAIEYEKALAITGPGEPFIASKLARTYLQLAQPEKAIAVATPLVKQDPEDAHLQATLGTAYVKSQQYKEAAVHLEAALRVSPFDPAVRCGLAQAYEALGKVAQAMREQAACSKVRE